MFFRLNLLTLVQHDITGAVPLNWDVLWDWFRCARGEAMGFVQKWCLVDLSTNAFPTH